LFDSIYGDGYNSAESSKYAMERLLTTKELAAAIGASESSLRRWTNSGAIGTSRTVGGHRRIPLSEAIRFIRDSHVTVVRPDLLRLAEGPIEPVGIEKGEAAAQKVFQSLMEGNAEGLKGRLLSMYLGGFSLAAIFDDAIAKSMERIGKLWEDDPRGILVEHRATDICLQAINRLRELLVPVVAGAPVAIGGAPQGDRYLLPSLMVATILADSGFRDANFGPDTPVDILETAAEQRGAILVWLSISEIVQKAQLQRDVEKLSEGLRRRNIRLVIGGRYSAELNLRALVNVQVMQSMTELAAFTRGAMPIAAGR
jgi:MerR family transcriptional regulator, light-induced transcriptional regulator